MSTIKAPFNFVPLSENVYFPNWADQISQDVPFKDGVSGTIELKITAETPIFVRNGHTKQDAEDKNETYSSFSKTSDGRYFIPATSIKGAIRNVLEIMSFGKMCNISNNRYSVRDLRLKNYMSFFQNSDVHCGWMTKNGENVTITDHGIPRRISYILIDEKLGTHFCSKFSDPTFMKVESNKTAAYKYKLAQNKELTYHFADKPLNPNNVVDKRVKVRFDEKGYEGTIVFTGQPSPRKEAERSDDGTILKKASGKFFEFVFPSKQLNSYTLDIFDKEGLYQDFCFVYKDSDDWNFWERKLEKGERVPVFFSLKDGKLIHFGLSYLYKLPYIKRIKDYLYNSHKSNKMDLAECIFGNTGKDKSLKGRVQFSNAFCVSGKTYSETISPYMGGPKPTYYPIYIKQNGTDGYMQDKNGKGVLFTTMLDKNAVLRGWKRYPVQSEWQTVFDNIPDNQKVNTNPFIPMQKGSQFNCKINFFNLKKVELGALLNAIVLNEGCFHSIGFAKPYGYGMVSVNIENINSSSAIDIESLKQEFITVMSSEVTDYQKSEQIRELKLMMRPQELAVPLEYMELNEFVEHKKQNFNNNKNQTFGQYQQNYSKLVARKVQKQNAVDTETEAVVTLLKPMKKAKLVEGKDLNGKELVIPASFRGNLKVGDRITVKKITKGGNILKLEIVNKI